MVKIRRADPSLMDKTERARATRELSPRAAERLRQQQQFARLIQQLTDRDQVFEVQLASEEKPLTIRQRILRAASDAKVEVAVRKHGDGFLVGLMTPERRSRRGRKAGSSRGGSNGT